MTLLYIALGCILVVSFITVFLIHTKKKNQKNSIFFIKNLVITSSEPNSPLAIASFISRPSLVEFFISSLKRSPVDIWGIFSDEIKNIKRDWQNA